MVDDNVEAETIYRCNGKAVQPIVRPHENHVLCMEWEPTWMESYRSNRYSQKHFLHLNHWIKPKSREHDKHMWSVVRLRYGTVAALPKHFHRLALKDNSNFTCHHVYN